MRLCFDTELSYFIKDWIYGLIFSAEKSKIFLKNCVCVLRKISRSVKNAKNFFRQKKMSEKSFWRKKMSQIFFVNFKIKKNFKILENIFWIFIFLKNNDFTFFKKSSIIDHRSIKNYNDVKQANSFLKTVLSICIVDISFV